MSTFIIRNRETLEQWTAASGKNSWRKTNHAKAAFAYSRHHTKTDPLLKEYYCKLGNYESLKFNDQDVYEIVELYSSAEKIAAANLQKLREVEKLLGDLKLSLGERKSLSLEDYEILHGDIENIQHVL